MLRYRTDLIQGDKVKFFEEREFLKKYGYLFLGALLLLLFYKLLNSFGSVFFNIKLFFGSIISVLMPILIGIVVAYFLFKPMRGIEKYIFKFFPKTKKKPGIIRLLSTLFVYAISLSLIVLFFNAVIPSIIESLTVLILKTPDFFAITNKFLGDNIANGGVFQEILQGLQDALTYFQNLTSLEMMNLIISSFGITPETFMDIRDAAFLVIKSTVGFIISFFIVFFIGLYTMLDKEKIIQQIDRFSRIILSEKMYSGLHWAVLTIDNIFYKYFTGKIFTSIFIGFLFYLGLLIIGVDYAPLFAMIVGATNMIPYFGPIIGAIPAVLITLIESPIRALWVAILILIVQQFDGNVLAPNVLGKIMELNPFWVLVSVVVGGSLFGILGMFVAIPVFGVIKVFMEEWLERREKKKAAYIIDEIIENEE